MNLKSLNRLLWQEEPFQTLTLGPHQTGGYGCDKKKGDLNHFESWKEKQYWLDLELAPALAQSCALG